MSERRTPRWSRILLKLSGEAFAGEEGHGIDGEIVARLAQAVIDLTPGEYVVWGDDPSVPLTPVALTVTGEFPTDVQDPTTDITATLLDFAIKIEGNLTAGKHLMKVQHQGAQPHFLDIEQGPDTMTNEQVQAALMGEMSGTPVAGGLSEGDLRGVFYSPTQSIGTVTFQQIDVSDGTFLAACFFPTAGTGVPHAMKPTAMPLSRTTATSVARRSKEAKRTATGRAGDRGAERAGAGE